MDPNATKTKGNHMKVRRLSQKKVSKKTINNLEQYKRTREIRATPHQAKEEKGMLTISYIFSRARRALEANLRFE